MPDPENWFDLNSYILLSDFDISDPILEEVKPLEPGSKWGMMQIMQSIYSDTIEQNILPLGNSSARKFDQISYSMLSDKHPSFYNMLMEDSYEEYADSVAMLSKSIKYEPLSNNDYEKLSILPKELLGLFVELLVSTVNRNEINIGMMLSDSELAGNIAAIALKENFRVTGAQSVYSDFQLQVQQMPMPSADEYVIYARYNKSVHSDIEGSAMFMFKTSLNEFGWTLTEFNNNYLAKEILR